MGVGLIPFRYESSLLQSEVRSLPYVTLYRNGSRNACLRFRIFARSFDILARITRPATRFDVDRTP